MEYPNAIGVPKREDAWLADTCMFSPSSARAYLNSVPLVQRAVQLYRDRPEQYKQLLVYLTCACILLALVVLNVLSTSYFPGQSLASLHPAALANVTEAVVKAPRFKIDVPPSNSTRIAPGSPIRPGSPGRAADSHVLMVVFSFLFVALFVGIRIVSMRRDQYYTRAVRLEDYASFLAMSRLTGATSGDVMGRLRLAMRARDFDSNDYEALLALDESIPNVQGASLGNPFTAFTLLLLTSLHFTSPGQIARLPCQLVTASDAAAYAQESRTCSICLAGYEEGQQIRTVSCFHNFHADCIDTWYAPPPTPGGTPSCTSPSRDSRAHDDFRPLSAQCLSLCMHCFSV